MIFRFYVVDSSDVDFKGVHGLQFLPELVYVCKRLVPEMIAMLTRDNNLGVVHTTHTKLELITSSL